MVDIEANIVKVGDREIPAQNFLSLAQYVIENISNGLSSDEIKQNLSSAGWEPSVLDLMFETDKIFEKYYSKQPALVSSSSENSLNEPHESFSLEKLENMDQELKSTISNFTKFEGKLESESGKIDQFQDRLDVLKDSLSETRGMFMSSERMAEFEMKIEKAESIIADFDPKTLQQRFSLVDKKLDAFEGQLTKLEIQLQDSTKQVGQYIEFMKKIKSQESVLENLNQLRDKMKEFHDIKSDLDRKSGKIEVIFQELQDKNMKIESAYSKVDSFSDVIKDIMRDIDRVSVKSATMISKDEMNKNISKLRSEIEVMKNVIYDSKKKKSFFGFGRKEEAKEEPVQEVVEESIQGIKDEIVEEPLQEKLVNTSQEPVLDTKSDGIEQQSFKNQEVSVEEPLDESASTTKVELSQEKKDESENTIENDYRDDLSTDKKELSNSQELLCLTETQKETQKEAYEDVKEEIDIQRDLQNPLAQIKKSIQEDQLRNRQELQKLEADDVLETDKSSRSKKSVEDKITSFSQTQNA